MLIIWMLICILMFKFTDFCLMNILRKKIDYDCKKRLSNEMFSSKNLNCKKTVSKNKIKRKAVYLKKLGYAFN